MRFLRPLAAALLVLWVGVGTPARQAQTRRPESAAAAQLRRIHEEAIAQPFDDARFSAYLKTLRRVDNYYVVEGDLRMTEDEVRLYLVAQSQRAVPADGSATELLVNLYEGRRDFYPVGKRRLTYAVDRASFPEAGVYRKVVAEMALATREWEEACASCGVSFTHVPIADQSPSTETVSFVVRMHEMPFVALAFFPHDPPERRYLDLHPLYLTAGYDSVGLLRHELGHTLGYRHEHAPGIAACVAEGDQHFERLTEYDSQSVMHYICNQTTGSSELQLTTTDREGHRTLYAVSTGAEAVAVTSGQQITPGAAAFTKAYATAASRPIDAEARAELAAVLPKYGPYYVLEGDLKVTEPELAAYIATQGGGARFGVATPELLLNTYRGERDFYPPSNRALTFVVDRASFISDLQYKRIVEDLEDAARSWESACPTCGIAFTHLESDDASPLSSSANFIVRRVDAGRAFVASSFLPHTARDRRIFEIDQSFFGSKQTSRLGVLRHQIGHILGYRHADIGRIAGCTRTTADWVPIYAVAADSVMRYICGPEDSNVELTERDIQSHRRLYEPRLTITRAMPPPSPEAAPGLLVVRFEGGAVGYNAAKVMEKLHEKGLLPVGTHTIAQNETTESLYAAHLQLPPSPELVNLAKRLNPKQDVKDLHIKDVLRIPQVTFVPGWFYLTFDATRDAARIEEIKKSWAHLEPRDSRDPQGRGTGQQQAPASQASQTAYSEKGLVRIAFRRYELRLPIKDARALDGLAKAINELDSKNIIVSVSDPLAAPGASRFFGEFTWHHFKELMLKPQGEGSLGGIAGMPLNLEQPQCDPFCPDLILLDSVVRLHPDVVGAIVSGGQPDEPPATPTSRPFLLDGQGAPSNVADSPVGMSHGTYMAGLIGSRLNSFGLVGINPWARIHSWDAAMLEPTYPDPTKLVDMIQDRTNSTWSAGLQIYVVATDYAVAPSATPAARITDDSFARKVHGDLETLLLVVAAGQPPEQGPRAPLDINGASLRGPANLGDQRNVIVVTACEQCTDPSNSRLMDGVNFSTAGFVHIAAPGDRIPGPVIGGKYAEGSKTSPATAIVAGVASLMVAKFPTAYKTPAALKRRLMVTSRVGSMTDATNGLDKVAAGFLDPETALRSPSVHYVQKFGETSTPATNVKWQAPGFQALNIESNEKYLVELRKVVRLIHSGDRIVVFESRMEKVEPDQEKVAVIRRVGPLKVGPAVLGQLLVSYTRKNESGVEEAVKLTLDEATDILLASVVGTEVR